MEAAEGIILDKLSPVGFFAAARPESCYCGTRRLFIQGRERLEYPKRTEAILASVLLYHGSTLGLGRINLGGAGDGVLFMLHHSTDQLHSAAEA